MNQLLISNAGEKDIDRVEAFRELAEQRAAGHPVTLPFMLPSEERRLYVRQTLREDNLFRIHNRPEGAQAKFDKLTQSLFIFFRGTALVFYRDIAGTDGHLPTVLTVGDIHPENFGVMPNEDGAPFFGIDDFDEAYFAPFSWDVKRGAAGFNIGARMHGWKRKKRAKVVRSFVRGYLEALVEFARDDREKWHQFRIDNSPPMIKELLQSAKSREEFLAEMIDLEKGRFVATEEIVPSTSEVEKFQKAIDQYRKEAKIEDNTRAGHFRVKDVAVKKGSGTASLGLDRYFVLIDGPTEDNADDIVLEIKQTRQSALTGLAPHASSQSDGKAERVVKSYDVHLVGGDPYYGNTTIDDESYLVRERSPYKSDIDIDELTSKGEMQEYADICGRTLAIAHARSDEDSGVMEGKAEERILSSIAPDVFVEDVVRFGEVTAARLKADYKAFCKDHALGAFRFVGT